MTLRRGKKTPNQPDEMDPDADDLSGSERRKSVPHAGDDEVTPQLVRNPSRFLHAPPSHSESSDGLRRNFRRAASAKGGLVVNTIVPRHAD
jgi:hypothetical protein